MSDKKPKLYILNYKLNTSYIPNVQVELKRWKDRVDALLDTSDNGAEWSKIKSEMQAAEEKAQELTDMINVQRKSLAEVTARSEEVARDFEQFRNQTEEAREAERSKALQDIESLRSDKNKREEMFKSLVADLKEVVTLVMREMQLKDIDWANMRGPVMFPNKIIYVFYLISFIIIVIKKCAPNVHIKSVV